MAWQDKQIWTVGNYRRMAKLPDSEYRELLHQITGYSTSKDAALAQVDFDIFMARIEHLLEWRFAEGMCPQPPAKINLGYWRGRLARNGEANRRLTHKLYDLWAELKPLLPNEHRTPEYLRSMASQALRGMRVKSISDLKAWQVHLVIEVLKARIFQTRRTLADDRAGLPGAHQDPDHYSDPIVPMIHEDEMNDPNIPDSLVPVAADEVPF